MGPASPHSRLAPALLLGLAGLAAPLAAAQSQGPLVVRDGSLGSGPLEVGPGTDPLGRPANYLITPEMGKQSDGNLFHSFLRFGIASGETATFTGPDAIDAPHQSVSNVISRVTGPEPSQIDGRLRSTIPGASLWLFNPSGVGFGEGAEIDVRGSFHAATADHLGFEGGLEPFYADGRPSVLATAPPAAFGFLPESGAASLAVDRSTLSVDPGETLELVAGDLSLAGAKLTAPGGHVGLEAQGEIALSQSLVDVGREGDTPGTISIRGGKILIQERSQVLAENESPVPSADPDEPGPGSISVEAGESVLVDDGLLSVNTGSAGSAGRIRIAGLGEGHPSPDVTFQNGPGYTLTKPEVTPVGARAETTGGGAGGAIEIDAHALVLVDGVAVSADAVGSPQPPHPTRGSAGTVEIRADSLDLSDRSSIGAAGWGSSGRGGSIRIDLGDGRLGIDGTPVAGAVGDPYTWIIASSNGILGTIEIDAGSVEVSNGGSITAHCNQNCIARTPPAPGAPEPPPNVWIKADDIRLERGGGIFAGTAGAGDGGTVQIDADSIRLETGGGILANTNGAGDAGRIVIDAHTLNISPGGIGANTFGSGNGGNIAIKLVDSLSISHGGFINAASLGSANASSITMGNAGSITIDADSVVLSGRGEDVTEADGRVTRGFGSNILALSKNSTGDAGEIEITARTLEIEDAGLISASSDYLLPSGRGGKGGTIHVQAERIWLHDGEPFSLAAVLADTERLTGVLSATVSGRGGGSITLEAAQITLSKGAIVATSTVGGGEAGEILLKGRNIRIEDGAFVDSTTLLTSAAAGSVTLRASESIELVGEHPVDGAASRVSSATLSEGAAGAVTLQAPRIVLDERGAVSTAAVPLAPGFFGSREGGAGGKITLEAERELLVQGGGLVTASTLGSGDGGSVDIRAGASIRVVGTASSIQSRTGAAGTGGDVEVRAPRIEVANGGAISARSAPLERTDGTPDFAEVGPGIESFRGFLRTPPETATGDAGVVRLREAETIRLVGGRITTSAGETDGGNIHLQATQLVHLDAGEITASVGAGAGGNITIDPVFVILENGSQIEATAAGIEGRGGRIQITTDNFFQFPGSRVSAQAARPEFSGTVEVHSPDVDLAGTLTPLPSSFLDAASLMRERCAARRSGERAGSFSVRGPGGIPAEPDGWLRAPVVLDAAATPTAAIAQPALFASLPGPLLAPGACP